ncbi:MAG: hypothetical protein R2707_02945 [Acidimicrobiales bacterium]
MSPAFERRAYMLDVSRDRVPTNETLEWLVGVLAACGFNELQLYVEHTFTYRGHETVWADASPLTHAEMRSLDDACERAGIDLVANMNGFGHMGRWLVHDEYRSRAECPDGFPSLFGGGRSDATCLAPTPTNAELAVELARDMASVVRNPRIHIGGDEPFELGEGASAAAVAERGRDQVYLEHLRRIIEPLVADGHEVMFWADLFRRDATLIPSIPAGAVPVVWNYEAPSAASWLDLLPADLVERLGLPHDANLGFVAHARLFVEADVPFWVAPGTSTWNTVIGRNRNAVSNIADAVTVGRANGSPGLLLTDWGDGGHWQPLPVSLPSIVRGGAAASTGTVPDDAEVWSAIDALLGCEAGIGELIDRLGNIGESVGVTSPNSSPLAAALGAGGFPVMGEPDVAGVEAADLLLTDATERFDAGSIGGDRGEVIAAEMAAACRLAHHGLRRLADERGIGLARPVALGTAAEVIEAQRAAWLRTSRPGGLDDSIAKLAL